MKTNEELVANELENQFVPYTISFISFNIISIATYFYFIVFYLLLLHIGVITWSIEIIFEFVERPF